MSPNVCDCTEASFKAVQHNDLVHVGHFKCNKSQNTPSYICSDEDIFRWCNSKQGSSRHLANGIEDQIDSVHVVVILALEIQVCSHPRDVSRSIACSAQSEEKPDQGKVGKDREIELEKERRSLGVVPPEKGSHLGQSRNCHIDWRVKRKMMKMNNRDVQPKEER